MAEILPQDKITEAKAWLHDVFIWGGLASTPKRAVSMDKYRYMYGTSADNFRNDPKDPSSKKYRDAAKTVCACIKNRQVETQRFLAFDKAIELLSQCHFLPDLTALRGNVKESAETLCKFIAWFCNENNLVYDNKNTSVEEMKQIKNTLIGKTLWDNFLYAKDAIPELNTNKGSSSTSSTSSSTSSSSATTASSDTGTPQATTVKQGGAAGHTLYRNNARGILTTGKLTNISNTGAVYWIKGEWTTPRSTDPKLHVKPQWAHTPLYVDYGSGQGYNDCILYFASEGAARNFLGLADAHKPNSVKRLYIRTCSEDKNGYVEVETEFGNAYIKASKLHEDIEEDLTEDKKETKVSNREIAEKILDGFFRD